LSIPGTSEKLPLKCCIFRERPPRMVRDQLRSDKVDRSKEVGISNGTAANRQQHKDVFTESSQRLDGSRMENKADEMVSSVRTERGYFGERPARRGGFRGRRMNRGRFMERSDRSRFEDGGRASQNGFGSPGIASDHSDGVSDRVERDGFRARDQRGGRRGWRGRSGYRRPFLRDYPPG